jgi:hypothetical protein
MSSFPRRYVGSVAIHNNVAVVGSPNDPGPNNDKNQAVCLCDDDAVDSSPHVFRGAVSLNQRVVFVTMNRVLCTSSTSRQGPPYGAKRRKYMLNVQ